VAHLAPRRASSARWRAPSRPTWRQFASASAT
jgi:hypothetical protein